MRPGIRWGAPAGFGRAGVLASSLLGLSLSASAESWHRSYERAQQQLVEGRSAEAETALLAAIAELPRPGCRMRTYGVKVRDYIPWYYLGVALQDQGRDEEAREAFARSLAEGVVRDCPGTQLQALDLLDRLDRLEAGPREGLAGPGELAALRESALSGGAERFAPLEVAQARSAERDCPSCPETAASWLEALSRARVDGPILLLLERSAREALLAAEIAFRREASSEPEIAVRREASSEPEALAALESAREALARAASPADWLAAEAAADRALSLSMPRPQEAPPPLALASDLGSILEKAIARAEVEAEASEDPAQARSVSAADEDLAAAKVLARSKRQADLEQGLQLAERARAGFVRQRGEEGEARQAAIRPALLELSWSSRARVAGFAVLPAGDEP